MSQTLFINGTVITMDAERRILEGGAVRVRGDRITQVAQSLTPEPGENVIDCKGKIVLPGLIDAHGHAGHCLIRGLGADTNPLWMKIVTPIYWHCTTREFWYADGLVGGLERLRAGVTTGVSILSSMPRSDDPEFVARQGQAYDEIGLRQILCTGPAGLPWPRSVTRWESGTPELRKVSFEEMMAGTEAAIETVNGRGNGRIQVYITPFTIVPSLDPSNMSTPDQAVDLTEDDRRQAREIRALARKHGVRMHSDAFAGHIRLAYQDKENALLGPDIHLQHCWGISPQEVDILAETGTSVSHAPPGRSTPVIEMIARGVNVALTTDGTAPSRFFDLFQTARLFQNIQHVLRGHDRYWFPPGRVLEMMTVDAAIALGLSHEIGSLEPGKKADIITIDMGQPHMVPDWLPVQRLIHQAVGADVDLVMVDGEVILKDRQPQRVDAAEIVTRGNAEARALVERANAGHHLAAPGWGQLYRSFDTRVALPDFPL